MNTKEAESKELWLEDTERGFAIREVGDSLHVRGITNPGRDLLCVAIRAAYPHGKWPSGTPDLAAFFPTIYAWIIDPAHREAFDRALDWRNSGPWRIRGTSYPLVVKQLPHATVEPLV